MSYGVELMKAISKYLTNYAQNAEITMAEFVARFNVNLVFPALDLTGSRLLILSATSAPALPLRYAVRIAASLPLYFPPVYWQKEWGLYMEQDLTGHLIIDSGLIVPFNLLRASNSL